MRSIKPTTIRLSEDDLELIEKVKRQYGQSSLIGAIRTALRVSVSQVNVATNVAQDSTTGTTPQSNAE